MESEHTPGPWTVSKSSIGGPTICSDKGDVLASIRTSGGAHCGGDQHPNTDANARLISAAPDLLAALQLSIGHHDPRWVNCHYADDVACAAIAKATNGA